MRGKNHYFSDAKLLALQRLASQSIGVKDAIRQRSLIFEQEQLIQELRLIQHHLEQLEAEIYQIIEHCREGQILTSIPGIGPIPAATLIATIGNIANFSRASELKSYLGWAPTREQTGTSFDRSRLTHGGARVAKQMLYLIVWSAIQKKGHVWQQLYERLVPRMCSYDERTQSYRGKGKVIGRIAGQISAMCYALLMTDYEATAHLSSEAKLPEPLLYDPEVHQRHRQGQYRPIKPKPKKEILIQQPDGHPS